MLASLTFCQTTMYFTSSANLMVGTDYDWSGWFLSWTAMDPDAAGGSTGTCFADVDAYGKLYLKLSVALALQVILFVWVCVRRIIRRARSPPVPTESFQDEFLPAAVALYIFSYTLGESLA